MWFVPDAGPQPATVTLERPGRPAPATMAQTKIRSDPLTAHERDTIADLFAVLETLVSRDELPAEARYVYDQAVLVLAQRYR